MDEPKATPSPAHPNGKRILILEDEHFISDLYTQVFTTAGYLSKAIYDGVEGFEEALTNRYDVILLDLMMPNMLGLDILAKLKSEVPNLKAKVIIITNLEQDHESRKAVEKQVSGYFIKADMTPHELVEHINQLF